MVATPVRLKLEVLLGIAVFAGNAAAQQAPFPTTVWSTATPESQGLDSEKLRLADQYVQAQCATRRSLLVVRNGYLVFERYYRGASPIESLNVRSIGKSILALLAGIAVEEGVLAGTAQKVAEWYPEYLRAGEDVRKFDLLTGHLLSMRSGFEWAESRDSLRRWNGSSDWHRYTLELPLAAAPGEVFQFNTGATHLLAGMLAKASRMTLLAYSQSKLFLPLGMYCAQWDKDPRGFYYGGSEMYFSARDVAKLGVLVARNGVWAGRQVVPASWLAEATRILPRTGSPVGDYGYLWWISNVQGYRRITAYGEGGQFLFVLPELDLVVVTSALPGDEGDASALAQEGLTILSRFVLPALRQEKPEIAADGVLNAVDYTPRLAPAGSAVVFGRNFTAAPATWDTTALDGVLPNGAGGVTVRVGGLWAPVQSVTPAQVTFLVPHDLPPGRHLLEVSNIGGTAAVEVAVADFAPAWIVFGRDEKAYVTPAPVRPGQNVELLAGGLGRTDPPAQDFRLVTDALPVAVLPSIEISGRSARVLSCVLAAPGVYRITAVIPDLPAGEHGVALSVNGIPADSLALLQLVP